MKSILFVDLDESLIKTDITREQLIRFFVVSPWKTMKLFFSHKFLPEGVKANIVNVIPIDPATLPYNQQVLDLIHQAKRENRPVVLATATHEKVAHEIAKHLGVFDAVIATTDTHNCKGQAKLEMMRKFAVDRPFDYVGDSHADLKIFAHTQTPIIVGGLHYSKPHQKIVRPSTFMTSFKALRPLQWIKNGLVFLPFAMTPHFTGAILLKGLFAFIILSLAASAVSILRDMGDVEEDRHDNQKKDGLFAKGELTVDEGLRLSLLCLIAGILFSLFGHPGAPWILLIYISVSFVNLFSRNRLPIFKLIYAGLLYVIPLIYGYVVLGN